MTITANRPIIEQRDRPTPPEQRTVDVNVEALEQRGRTLHGYAAVYGAESGDLGGFRERIQAGAFAGVLGADADVRCLLNHDPNVVLGRTASGTLRLFDEQRGLRFEVDLPESRQDIREAVQRGDIDGASFRFKVGEESWEGEMRTVKTIAELHDVTVATYGAYPEASVELRTRPEGAGQGNGQGGGQPQAPPVLVRRGLPVESRTQDAGPTLEQRVGAALRSIRKGEARSLDTVNADPVTPTEQAQVLFDALRASSIALASGLRVIPTTRESIAWPQLTTSVDPGWVAEGAVIPAGDPAFAELTATPRKLAHRVVFSNEVADDSEPAIIDVLNTHLATMLGLKLDLAVFEGNDVNGIRGLKFTPGVQTISMGTNGAALTDYDPFVEAIGMLQAANVPGPYAIAIHPTVATALALLKETTGVQLARPADLPTLRTSSQLSTTETAGTATAARSAYVYSPSQVILVRRADATIEVDRSRLFDSDQSEMRGKLRADLLVPNPVSVVRITGITTV
jgi:HK97 family phage major capsid protein/HK97 family phage prohead protease